MKLGAQSMMLAAKMLIMLITAGCLGQSSYLSASKPTEPNTGATNMVHYELTLARNSFFPGEEVQVRVKITNQQTVPIQLPDPNARGSTQPVHTMSGPGYPDGILFGNIALLKEPAEKASAIQKMITLAPGASWNGVVALDAIVNLSTPGQYRLHSSLNWQDLKAESSDITFSVRPLTLRSVHLGLGLRPFDNGEGEGAFLNAVDGSNHLYTFSVREMQPSIGEASLGKPIHRLAVGPDATEVAVPWRNSPFFNELLRYVLWREDQTIKMISSTSRTPFSFAPPAGISRLVRPPLKVTGGPVEVAAISADARSLQWIRFDATSGVGSVGWTIPLPAAPHGITAALGPEAGGSKRHLAFTSLAGEAIDLYYVQFSETGPPEPFQSARVDGWRLLEGASPAILAEADGTVLIIVPVSGKRDGKVVCATVEVQISPPDGRVQGDPLLTQLGVLSSRPVTGAAMLVDKDGRVTRREVVISFERGPLLKFNGRDRLVPVSVPGTPTVPILMAPGKNVTYILYIDPERGLVVEPL